MIFSENLFPPRIKSGAGFFGIMFYCACGTSGGDAVASFAAVSHGVSGAAGISSWVCGRCAQDNRR